ncbi:MULTISPECIES: gluconate 5-dehydrogenase [Yersinia pseudotuberculosis complex]|uniref:Gluconate 5-dehydrogenase n=1 Tax=Yersinia pseudotuberculosis TaxID=633 RepID=A0ABN5R2Z7_YERPU|nr:MULTISPECIES: gluconate 5-dehydrogenase [Yersinia pseudotuberculosis complex]AXY35152.1 gluconate 5-dehydrogenase [Yersinia pseudotuberculosis]AYW84352.1 gluconate 5-dehydrogenase [Yersinia pestis]AYW91176.1 gluconate 5-dehydrogenase [Yersinia pseudotuberculosis]AYW95525.1 gluconate 5-dehydrogenase [Yersinia pseudotuberculosis]AYX10814.1 gluconate 5-dehydrogenase [Yersinia pseudotuberculosis]
MDVFTASLRSACSLRRGHFVNNLKILILLLTG